jgi:predicted ATPase/DNA-binding CsgD family transcriptional regulator
MSGDSPNPPDLLIEPLTRREQEILDWLATDLSNREIAGRLVLAPTSVKWYTRQIYAKLGVNDRQQAIERAKSLGLLNGSTSTTLPPHNLPVSSLPFVGRQQELERINQLLADPACRLLSLVGPGGCGKTRLAQKAGAMQLKDFTNGVYFVSLAPLEESESILPTIASAIGFKYYSGKDEPRQQLLNYLREKNMLLILDNFEHLLDGIDLATAILQSSPKIKIIATSRARLNVLEEQLYPVSGLNLPDSVTEIQKAEYYSAISLFRECARRISPEFELTADNLEFVIRICRAVQGFPLGILLATGWLKMLTPPEIAAAIERDFAFLEADLSDLPERQRSMRAVFNQSWKILTEHEREIFSVLSVFRGGFTAEVAHAVVGATLHDLMGLVNKSLIQRDPNGRYHLHELVKQFSAEKLTENPERQQAIQDIHCAYFAEFLHQREANLHGKDQGIVLNEIESEIENIRGGWVWAVEHSQVDRLADYLESMSELYNTRGWSQDGVKLIARAFQNLTTADNDCAIQLLRGRLLMWQGILSSDFETADNTNQPFQDSVTIFRRLGARKEMAYALCYFGILMFYDDCRADAESFCQEGLSLFKEIGEQRGIALALMGLAWIALHKGDFLLAKQRYQDSLTLLMELGDPKDIAHALDGLGYVCWIRGEYQESKQHNEEMLALSREIGDQRGIAGSLGSLGIVTYGLRDYQKSRELLLESLALYKEIGHSWGVADRLGDLGELALAMGEYEQAAQFARESNAVYARIAGEFHSWGLRVSGNAALGLGDLQTAQTYLRQSLEHAIKIHRWGFELLTIVGIARLFMKQGKEDRALELLALVMNHRASWQLAKDQAAPLIAELEAKLPPDVLVAAQARGRARDLESTVQELLVELADEESGADNAV